MKKRLLAALMAGVTVFSMAGCTSGGNGGEAAGSGEGAAAGNNGTKIGAILVGDENEGYTYAHIEGIKKAAEASGIAAENIIWKYSVPEDESCETAAKDLVDQGCSAIFSNSYGHQSFMQQVASEYPDVSFVSMTGDTAAASGLDNFSNAFTKIYESRYVSGVVAGMKVAELVANNELDAKNYDADGNVLIGYVGAYPYAEVVSGYTAFFLGVQSVYQNVSMEVTYTNSWFDITAEGEAANALMADGCVIIGQHADSTGAPTAVQAALDSGKVAYSVGYNVDMLNVAPTAALTSATNNWSVYYKHAFDQVLAGSKIDTNWAEGYSQDAVAITALGPSVAAGTADKVAEVEAAIKSGSLHVFDTSKFTVGGSNLSSFVLDDGYEAISDGYFHESEHVSAPYFSLRIDGIKELN
ncbi:MAG: BMP family ABC transporter substrate-binding protein [Lachnospiraceae bacterium]|nr:BMP family ABC transporter substrate-binding protein [Lachnospiraceae bacterium]